MFLTPIRQSFVSEARAAGQEGTAIADLYGMGARLKCAFSKGGGKLIIVDPNLLPHAFVNEQFSSREPVYGIGTLR